MVLVKFKNLEKSDNVKDIVEERISEAVERFPRGKPRMIVVTLAMENSPLKPGPDVFRVRTELFGGRYHGLILEKSADNLYSALASVCERLLERLNRFSDRLRMKALKQSRKLTSKRNLTRNILTKGE